VRAKAPGATIILTAIFPRNDKVTYKPLIDEINLSLSKMADVRFLNINDKLAETPGVLNERDKLHPTVKGYQIWADALNPF
jgi:lysophospholipase L1-like esterase